MKRLREPMMAADTGATLITTLGFALNGLLTGLASSHGARIHTSCSSSVKMTDTSWGWGLGSPEMRGGLRSRS